VVVVSSHFASFFLGLEILGISLYVAISYMRTDPLGIEAGIKYLILAATSDAILLFGVALLYGECGTLEFGGMAQSFAGHAPTTLALGGLTLLVAGIGFKLSLVPFHMWTPDVYEGAPAPITGFLATVSKGAVFALLLRYFTQINLHQYDSLVLLFSIIAAASMVVGNLLALLQENVKRIVAYASIAHMGYLLVAFLSVPGMAAQAVGYYFAAYFAATIGAFGVIGLMSERNGSGKCDVRDYRGLFWRKPLLAGVFTVMLLSMAGIPLTAGFVAKFYIMAAGVKSSLWALVIILIGTGTIGLYYYFRIIASMCLPYDESQEPYAHVAPGVAAGFVLAFLTLVVFILGVYPASFISLVQRSLSL
jgi:NADH-quinone oxidoreductase subunit N